VPFDLDRYHAALTTTRVGRRLEYREQTGSTMDDARAALDADPASEGIACVGGEQLTGRGRLGRHWVSAPGVGLYVTYHLRPAVPANAPLISLAAALAVAGAAHEVSAVTPVFKWPNDVLHHDGRKLCGILAESRSAGDRLDVFLGIGVNVRPNPNHPPEVAAIAVSLEEIAGAAPALEDLAAALSNALERHVTEVDRNPDDVVAAWRANLATLGQPVAVHTAAGTIEGQATDVGPRGELIVVTDEGIRREISAGDVVARPVGQPG
jgi:BirA family biotin operon repressor/biotin-[acetyl-CoA-carboxylase] ligase